MPTITNDRLRELLHYDPETGLLTWRIGNGRARTKAGDVAGSLTQYGYIQIKADQKKFMAHRLAWQYMTGLVPVAEIDHINRVRTDNRFCNLREATKSQNHQNRGDYRGREGLRGVRQCHTGKWFARIKVRGQTISLGRFVTMEEAVAARREAETRYFTHLSRE